MRKVVKVMMTKQIEQMNSVELLVHHAMVIAASGVFAVVVLLLDWVLCACLLLEV